MREEDRDSISVEMVDVASNSNELQEKTVARDGHGEGLVVRSSAEEHHKKAKERSKSK